MTEKEKLLGHIDVPDLTVCRHEKVSVGNLETSKVSVTNFTRLILKIITQISPRIGSRSKQETGGSR